MSCTPSYILLRFSTKMLPQHLWAVSQHNINFYIMPIYIKIFSSGFVCVYVSSPTTKIEGTPFTFFGNTNENLNITNIIQPLCLYLHNSTIFKAFFVLLSVFDLHLCIFPIKNFWIIHILAFFLSKWKKFYNQFMIYKVFRKT